jgi:putative ABC transport system substrate-binding protein
VSSLAADEVYGSLLLGLRDLGYVEGRNLVVELRSADGKADQLAAQAAELVKAKVDVIVTGGSQATSAAQKETQTIPIVMGTVSDPVGSGFVKSLGHPGGNITGLSNLGTGITSKHFELLRDMVPKMSRAALLVNSTNSSRSQAVAGIEAAGRKANVKVMRLEASTPREIERAFETMATNRIDGLIVALDSVFAQQRRQFAELGLKHRMPAIYAMREHVEAGALMSYGQNISDNFRRAAAFVDKIFKGAKAGDLPVEQSTTFELYINGKTARALGLTIPQSLLISADKVIE